MAQTLEVIVEYPALFVPFDGYVLVECVVLLGGMQDYNYVWAQCLELTLEISCCKFPSETQLPGLWEANRPALLAYMQQVHLGRYSIDTFAHILKYII